MAFIPYSRFHVFDHSRFSRFIHVFTFSRLMENSRVATLTVTVTGITGINGYFDNNGNGNGNGNGYRKIPVKIPVNGYS